ncbi:MAG: hypothetical protein HKO65_17855 [Gemmatimonadetes bacterium]|nr:hypothetical protein [Gemmatimonadota bacterium]NNM06965.1 hypothetical protein [Gemmatimonadota bacterium]
MVKWFSRTDRPLARRFLLFGLVLSTYSLGGSPVVCQVVTPDTLLGYEQFRVGMFFSGDDWSRDFYEGGEYLEKALPNISDFRGYAGHYIDYFDPDRTCLPNAELEQRVSLESLLPDGQYAASLEPNGKLVEYILSESSQSGAGITRFFSGQVSESSSVHLLVQDVAHRSAIGLLDGQKVEALRQKGLPEGVCRREIITAAVLTEASSKIFHETDKSATANGFFLKVNGKWHLSTQYFQRVFFVRVETRW